MPELDANKLLNAEVMRSNLLLSSLYLSAYEILKATIIEGVKNIIVFFPEPNDDEEVSLDNEHRAINVQGIDESDTLSYERQVQYYERQIGIQFEQRDRYGLIPSCNWLKTEGVLSSEDVETVKMVREHRNQIAHELPALLITKGFDVDLSYLNQIIEILRKVEPFFARIDADIPADVPDEEIMSGGQVILGMIWNTVTEHLQEVAAES